MNVGISKKGSTSTTPSSVMGNQGTSVDAKVSNSKLRNNPSKKTGSKKFC